MDNKKISEVFLEISEAIESGKFGKKVKIGLTTLGSEHGVENMKKAIELAKSDLFEVVVIGERVDDEHETYEVDNDEDMYKKMEELLDSGEIQACVTLHYNFPIGVSTVGRVYTPGHGKEMFLATTTGTSDTERTKAMVRNAVAGIIAAKSCGIAKPTVGILNIDGARQVEKALKHFKDNGFDIEFAESQRADGGIVMRGNDLLMGSCDVMVTDSLTGNLLMKMFGSFTSGGNYETTGFGYGPGIGEGYERNIFIVSRASGAPVVANALKYAYQTVAGGIDKNKKSIYKQAEKADFKGILDSLTKKEAPKESSEEVKMPDKEVVSATISGIDILEIEDAVQALWKENIYAESGMGCTGPIVQVSDANLDKASQILKQNGYIE
ncbi:glycine/sarcosine/betaine reductase complex component C subunit alpha [Finegoldia magna]|uniref:glycine/sarcosine/betaine reductase complex component C subunit alpha n=1 Tax=Finegoldia magna TaxID=1260 RepID=UPI0012AF27AE|nr:glycine/sarcosine/betaine reductase complex component C subunit alpha [Finegoldia magna]MSB16782.1 glycine reductase [Finegoldia magna]MSD45588.1 glycine reductase [Finegoldia magna]